METGRKMKGIGKVNKEANELDEQWKQERKWNKQRIRTGKKMKLTSNENREKENEMNKQWKKERK